MSTVTIRAHAIARRFGDEQAVAGVDLEIRAGEIVALVGLNGAGKSTLMRLLLGMLRPDSGTAEVLGCPVVDADRSVWSRVGHLIETPPRYGELTVAESVYSAARLQGWNRRSAREAAVAIITDLELSHWQHRATRTLSLGNRQRLGIAMALVHRPDVLVLDEPSNSLDPLGVVRVRQLLRMPPAKTESRSWCPASISMRWPGWLIGSCCCIMAGSSVVSIRMAPTWSTSSSSGYSRPTRPSRGCNERGLGV